MLPPYDGPVLIEGANYAGIWMECGPHEALVFRKFRPDVARDSHFTFFKLQRPDGQLPANNKVLETGFGQIQMVVPIAATAWELARAPGDEELLHTAYRACSLWDDWLKSNRNTRGTELVEGFCPTIPATTTVRDGPASRRSVRTRTLSGIRRSRRCRVFVRISRPQHLVAGWRLRRWRRRSDAPRIRLAGLKARTGFAD